MEITTTNNNIMSSGSSGSFADSGDRSIHEAAQAAAIMQRALIKCSRAVNGTTRIIGKMGSAAQKAANAMGSLGRVQQSITKSRTPSPMGGRSYGDAIKDLKSSLDSRAIYTEKDIGYSGARPRPVHPDFAPNFRNPVPAKFDGLSNGGITVAGLTLAPTIGISASILGNDKELDERELASRIDRELASLWKSSRSELRRLIEQ